MRIKHQTSIFVGDNSKSEHYENANNNKKNKGGTIFAGDLNKNLDPIAKKRKEAREKAMKVVGDAFANEKKIDADLQYRRDHISELRENMSKAQDELKKVEENKSQLKKSYGITDDSQEHKDLKLLEKRRDSLKRGSTVTLSEEDKGRLTEIDEVGITEYQSRSLEMDAIGYHYGIQIEEAQDTIIEENAIIRGVELERLKTHPILDATKEADAIMNNTSDEIMGMLVEEAKDYIDEEAKEKEEVVEKKAEKQEKQEEQLDAIKEKREEMEELANAKGTEFIKLDKVKSDVQTEVENIIDKMKLVVEDIKGAVVDSKF